MLLPVNTLHSSGLHYSVLAVLMMRAFSWVNLWFIMSVMCDAHYCLARALCHANVCEDLKFQLKNVSQCIFRDRPATDQSNQKSAKQSTVFAHAGPMKVTILNCIVRYRIHRWIYGAVHASAWDHVDIAQLDPGWCADELFAWATLQAS